MPILLRENDGFRDNLAEFVKDRSLVLAVAPPVDESGRASNEALVFLRPLNDLCVSGAFLHARFLNPARGSGDLSF